MNNGDQKAARKQSMEKAFEKKSIEVLAEAKKEKKRIGIQCEIHTMPGIYFQVGDFYGQKVGQSALKNQSFKSFFTPQDSLK